MCMCQSDYDPLNKMNVDALDIKALYDKTTDFWFKVGEPLYIGCPIGHAGFLFPGRDEPWNERIGYLGGAIGNLKQTIFWLEKAFEYEKAKAKEENDRKDKSKAI